MGVRIWTLGPKRVKSPTLTGQTSSTTQLKLKKTRSPSSILDPQTAGQWPLWPPHLAVNDANRFPLNVSPNLLRQLR
jgi:hypothetical protein